MKNLITLELTPREANILYRAFITSNIKADSPITPLESKLWESKNKAYKMVNKI